MTWQILSGGGVLEEVDTETNVSGLATGIYRLGTLPGTNFVRVSIGTGGLFADFKATASAGPPAEMEPVLGDEQTGVPGAWLAPFVVRVTTSSETRFPA